MSRRLGSMLFVAMALLASYIPEVPYLCAVGIEVNAVGPNRRPSTATLPEDTVKSAEPRLPGIPPRPGRFLKAAAILLLASPQE